LCCICLTLQKVIERVQAETVPATDFKLTVDEEE
jgi:hypothetical protein